MEIRLFKMLFNSLGCYKHTVKCVHFSSYTLLLSLICEV